MSTAPSEVARSRSEPVRRPVLEVARLDYLPRSVEGLRWRTVSWFWSTGWPIPANGNELAIMIKSGSRGSRSVCALAKMWQAAFILTKSWTKKAGELIRHRMGASPQVDSSLCLRDNRE